MVDFDMNFILISNIQLTNARHVTMTHSQSICKMINLHKSENVINGLIKPCKKKLNLALPSTDLLHR